MRSSSSNVVVVGGGLAALETVLALHDLGEGTIPQTVVATSTSFRLRPHEVERPFGRPVPRPLDLPAFLHDHAVGFRHAEAVAVDPHGRRVRCADGAEIDFDVLVLAQGARAVAPAGDACVFGLPGPPSFADVLADARRGEVGSLAFTLDPATTWPLPLYELALLTAADDQVRAAGVSVHIDTPELTPLGIFGPPGAEAVTRLLDDAGIGWFGAGRSGPPADARVTLPVLVPRPLEGLPVAPDGFLPLDAWCRVRGVNSIYGVGDATSMAVKQGGLSCEQALVAARHIAAEAGAPVRPQPMHAVLRGRLVTGEREHFLRRDLETHRSAARESPLWQPATKVASSYLAPWLAAHHGDVEPGPARDDVVGAGGGRLSRD